MNIAKESQFNIFNLRIEALNINLFKRFVGSFLFILMITLTCFVVIHNYCDLFYKFSDDAKSRIIFHQYQAYYLTPILFWLSTFLHKKYAFNPYGTGLDNITFALKKLQKYPNNYKKVSNLVGAKTALIVIVSSLISTYAGGSLGREAPSILIAVCICFASAYYFRKYILKLPLEIWAYVGYTIGMAIAFNAPVAGLVYLFEKLVKNRCLKYVRALIVALIALVFSCILLSGYKTVYFVKDFAGFKSQELIHYLLITILSSILAFLMLKICRYYYIKFIAIKSRYWHLIPIVIGFGVALIGINFGIFAIGGGIRSVNEAFLSDTIIHTDKEFIGRYLSTIMTYIAGNFGGLVAPALALGNILGSVYAQLFGHLDAHALMLIGMVAFLAPVLNVPITSAFIVVESTAIGFDNIYILLLSSIISFSLMIIFQKIGAKIRAKLYNPTTN